MTMIRYDAGMRTHREVLGDEHVERAEAGNADPDLPFQEMITESARGTVWASDTISLRERSMLTLQNVSLDIDNLRTGTARDGVPVPSLVAQLNDAATSSCVHKGATSQDVIDSSLVLVLRDTSELIAGRLAERIRAGGAGIPAFFTPSNFGTELAEGNPVQEWRC